MACLYHCDFGNDKRYSAMLRNINNHLSVYDFDPLKIKIVIVAHSAGIKYHLKTLEGTPWAKKTIDPELGKRMDALGKYGVEVYLCQITFKSNKIDFRPGQGRALRQAGALRRRHGRRASNQRLRIFEGRLRRFGGAGTAAASL